MTAVPAPAGGGREEDHARRELRLVLVLMVAYSAIHVGFRLAASLALGEDDPLENLLVQDLRAIYDPRQPPLYDWVLYAVQSVTGPTIVSFLAIKYAALIGTGAALYAIARRAIGAGVTALLAVESLALIYQLSWRYHEGYTHQVGAMLAVAAAMWATLRAADAPQAVNLALLGAVVALGTLTQPVFLVFALALALAVAAEPSVRSRFDAQRLAVVAVPVLLSLGFLLWQATRAGAGSPFVPPHSGLATEWMAWPGWSQAWGGFLNAARAPLFYLSPLILIVPLFFRGFLSRAWADISGLAGRGSDIVDPSAPGAYERIVLRTSVAGFVLSLAGASVLGLKGYSSHVFMPLYLTSVVWIMGVVRRTMPAPVALARFGRLALAIAVVALVARLANMFVLDPVCRICRWGVPYAGLAAELKQAGADTAVVVTPDRELGGNLRAVLPRATIALPGSLRLQSAATSAGGGPVVAVWHASMPDSDVARALGAHLQPGQSVAEAALVRVPWRHLWRPVGYRFSEWKILPVRRPGAPVSRVP